MNGLPTADQLQQALNADDDQIKRRFADLAGCSPSEVLVMRLTEQGVYNNLWQGQALTTHFKLCVAILNFTPTADKHERIRRAVVKRLNPEPNGFDAIAVARPNGKDRWTIGHVVEYHHSPVGDKLKQILPSVSVDSSFTDPQPYFPPITGAATPPEYPTPAGLLRHLARRKNLVLQGPPGTGKTHLALEAAKLLASPKSLDSVRFSSLLAQHDFSTLLEHPPIIGAPLVWELVQFHASYTYEDFVRGLAPAPGAGLAFAPKDGIFLMMCEVARRRGRRPTLLIIDEMNRAQLSNVFGELVVAIDADKRESGIRVQYPAPVGGSQLISVPSQLWLLGTMNSADRSIALVDIAIRRRFRFIDVPPSASQLRQFYGAGTRATLAERLLSALGAMVAYDSLAPGHSFLMVENHGALSDQQWIDAISRKLAFEVFPLLREYARESVLNSSELRVGNVLLADVRNPVSAALLNTQLSALL